MKIPTCRLAVPDLSAEQMIEVDRAMIEDYGIDLVQMMENAGRNLAALARERFLGQSPEGKRVVALAGTGGNGGGVLVAVRRLLNWGAQVEVVTTRKDEALTPVPARQLRTARRVGAVVSLVEDDRGMDSVDLLRDRVGELYLADIGVPPALYAGDSLGLQVGPIFAECDIVQLRP